MARRSKDGSIIINVGSDAQRHLDRVAKRERIASERAAKREAKKAATRERQALRQTGKRAAQMARKLARKRARDARDAAKPAGNNKPTDDYNRQREENARKKRKKRPFHPRGPNATEKYNSYARREERSRKLRASRTSPTTFTCNGYTIKVTAGSDPKPLSCTCPDFTQIEGSRNWLGSKAGPFNPCKHMMAVRDLAKWKCVGGVCIKSADGTYNSQAECEAALVPPSFTGGQCVGTVYTPILNGIVRYVDDGSVFGTYVNLARATRIGPLSGLRMTTNGTPNNLYLAGTAAGVPFLELVSSSGGSRRELDGSGVAITLSGSPDDCGNAPPTCP